MQDNRSAFRPAPGEIPKSPGVYRFLAVDGSVLYIGKAKNLRQRLANYFQPLHTLAPRTMQMLQRAAALDWTVVGSDTEALVLEQQRIRAELPPYNVVFRDDKSFPYLVVTLGHEAPRLEITRRKNIRGAKYYGPYPKLWALKQTYELLIQAFPIRTCKDSDYKAAMASGKPCLAGQIGKCHGPCSGRVTISAHREMVTEMVNFLNTLDSRKVAQLQRSMLEAAAAQEFEKAAKLRDQMLALQQILESNHVVLPQLSAADFFALYSDDLTASVHQFIVRDGRIRGERSWLVDIELEQQPGDLMAQVLQDAYQDNAAAPQIFVSVLPSELEAVQEILRQTRPRRGTVKITVPERGDTVQLLQTATKNAGEQLQRYKLKRASDLTSRTEALAGLQEALKLDRPPLRIDCVDVSHMQGTNVVAAVVAFADGLPLQDAYRKYKISQTRDDTDSIHQTVSRRAAQWLREEAELRRETAAALQQVAAAGEKFATVQGVQRRRRSVTRPDLLLVDGGVPQVNAAVRALSELGVTDVAICGIAKRMEELWLPDEQYPVILPRQSEELFLLQRIRDTAHRFAITFQRQQREAAISTALAQIPGIGDKRAAQLLQHFGSLHRVREATLAQLQQVPGVGEATATKIFAALRAERAASMTQPDFSA
ncbi:excinuclease ABC subunit UvrC [Canibacter oris]|uniref:UvrABC system protein C n=1 Tax=Canibacter oris TaxID=1365628 RepID=A0A840DCS4_9MICO|nr:excinuclease ABC subunit UvrC [Canibacter oris]MBB4070864.1 excinuclease ABC subunit C [Canibacter oris]